MLITWSIRNIFSRLRHFSPKQVSPQEHNYCEKRIIQTWAVDIRNDWMSTSKDLTCGKTCYGINAPNSHWSMEQGTQKNTTAQHSSQLLLRGFTIYTTFWNLMPQSKWRNYSGCHILKGMYRVNISQFTFITVTWDILLVITVTFLLEILIVTWIIIALQCSELSTLQDTDGPVTASGNSLHWSLFLVMSQRRLK